MIQKKSVNQLAQIIRGVSYKPEDVSETIKPNYVPVLRAMNIDEGSLNFEGLVYINSKRVNLTQKLLKGDVLIAASTGSKKVIGKAAQSLDDWNGSFGAFCLVLRPNSDLVNTDYFSYFFQSDFYRRTISHMSSGANINNLKREYFDRLQVPLPPLEEQNNIVKVLKQANGIRKKRYEAIKLLDDYIKSLFLEMFGDPVVNEKEWPRTEFRNLGNIITGNTPPRVNEEYYKDKYIEWIKTDNIKENNTFITEASEYLSQSGAKLGRSVESGAILVACIAGSISSIGRAAITDRRVAFNQQINAIQPNKYVNTYFLYSLLKYCRSYIQAHASKGMKRILTKGEFEKLTLIIPPIEIQNQYAKYIIIVEEIKKKMLSQSDELEKHFQALMQSAFETDSK